MNSLWSNWFTYFFSGFRILTSCASAMPLLITQYGAALKMNRIIHAVSASNHVCIYANFFLFLHCSMLRDRQHTRFNSRSAKTFLWRWCFLKFMDQVLMRRSAHARLGFPFLWQLSISPFKLPSGVPSPQKQNFRGHMVLIWEWGHGSDAYMHRA